VPCILCLSGYDRDVFARQEFQTRGKERDARSLIKAEVIDGREREGIAQECHGI